ncbi:hypothetical protein [Actinoplanes sp. HUAS TT8]|uniref:hypothetical protein n=1 Tax=Actinoplanes sp. HUAS TT8 TaxID=3447453 RepID=UPI003F51B35D
MAPGVFAGCTIPFVGLPAAVIADRWCVGRRPVAGSPDVDLHVMAPVGGSLGADLDATAGGFSGNIAIGLKPRTNG